MYCLEIISENYRCSIPFERRIVVLRGDSGTGKISLADIIATDAPGFNVSCGLPCRVVTSADWKQILYSVVDTLLITDDLKLAALPEFIKTIRKTASFGNYYLIILDDNCNLAHPGLISGITHSIFKCVKDAGGAEQEIELQYESIQLGAPGCADADLETSRYDFFSHLFGCKVMQVVGKSSVVKKLQEMLLAGYTSVIVVFNPGVPGYCEKDLCKVVDRAMASNPDSRVCYFTCYEDFEQFLLCSAVTRNVSFVKDMAEDIKEYAKRCQGSEVCNRSRQEKCNLSVDKSKTVFLLEKPDL